MKYACRILVPLVSILSFFQPGSSGIASQNPSTPLTIDNKVVPGSSKDFLTDPRILNPEFYIKFYPELHLTSQSDATRDWINKGAKACRRGSFLFSASDYLNRNPDLPKGDCVAAAQHFVTVGFNEGRIGAFDSYWTVFDFNYYVDSANNPDLNKLVVRGVWDQTDAEVHWLQHGIMELRVASPFFSIKEYQSRYSDVPSDPRQSLFQYVAQGQSMQRMGRVSWADPAQWNLLVQRTEPPRVSVAPTDVVRSFTSARGLPIKVVVKSPVWYQASQSPPWSRLSPDAICLVPPPTAEDDRKIIQSYLDRLAEGSLHHCQVVRLAPGASYHIVLPANLPPEQDWILNHLPHLTIHNAKDFVLDGNGSTLYFTGSTAGIDVVHNQRGVIENLTLDWGNPVDTNPAWRGPLFDAIGTIKKDSPTSAHIELDRETPVPSDFSPYIFNFSIWDRSTGKVASDDYLPGPNDRGCDAYCLSQHDSPEQSMRLKERDLYPNSNPKGRWVASNLVQFSGRDVLVYFSQFPLHALKLTGTRDIRIVHCTIHASPYMGIVGGSGERGISLENLSVTPSQARHISTIADGVHLTGSSGDIIIDHALFEAQGDDAINMGVVWDTLTAVASNASFSMVGEDAPPLAGDTLAFFDETLAFIGAARAQSSRGTGPYAVRLERGVEWLRTGIKAINMSHIPSHFYMSGLTIRKKPGHGIIIGGLHGLIENSTFESLTMSGIVFHFSSFWSEGAPSSDIAIRDNQFIQVCYSPKFYQYGTGLGTYPHRSAVLSIFSELATNYNKAQDDFIGIYPAFQDIEISGNRIQGLTGAGIYMAAVSNGMSPPGRDGILQNHFGGCGAVPDTSSTRTYFGSASTSAVVMTFARGISLVGNQATADPNCSARVDYSSSAGISIADH